MMSAKILQFPTHWRASKVANTTTAGDIIQFPNHKKLARDMNDVNLPLEERREAFIRSLLADCPDEEMVEESIEWMLVMAGKTPRR